MKSRKNLDIGFWFPRPGRGERLAHELRQRGHQVTLYHDQIVSGEQMFTRKVEYDTLRGFLSLLATTHQVYYTSRSFLPVLQLYINSKLRRTPYVYTVNGGIWAYYEDRAKASRWARMRVQCYPKLFDIALNGASAIIGNSHFLANEIRGRYPNYASKVHSIYNGINFESVLAGKRDPGLWPAAGVQLLSVVTANLARKVDGILLILDAFEHVWKQWPEVSLVVAAKSSIPVMAARINEKVSRMPCAHRVRVEVNSTRVPDLLATADVFLYATPSDSSDSMPRALLEAQVANIPTAATRTCGCTEVVIDGLTGRAVAYDAGALATGILDLITHRARAECMADKAKMRLFQNFTWEQMALYYEEVFQQVIKKSHSE